MNGKVGLPHSVQLLMHIPFNATSAAMMAKVEHEDACREVEAEAKKLQNKMNRIKEQCEKSQNEMNRIEEEYKKLVNNFKSPMRERQQMQVQYRNQMEELEKWNHTDADQFNRICCAIDSLSGL